MQRGRRKPDWLKSRPPSGSRFTEIKSTLRDHDLHTVCEEANCPNMGECWSGGASAPPDGEAADAAEGGGTATFMLMGDRCSRGCNFCDVETGGMEALDTDEPANVADAVAEIGLDYVVLTSVDRDDLADGGSAHFAETIREIKRRDPEILVETLIPDFQGDPAAIDRIIDAEPDVIAHNVETVERLQWPVRDRRANYEQSLAVLDQVDRESDIHTKTSLMLGVGEYDHEVYRTLGDLREVGVDVVTFGQYLRPSRSHLDVFEYVHPDVFETWRRVAEAEFDFLYCASGAMVRSSYKAGELFVEALLREGRTPEDARRHARAAGGD
ncbi:MULTISPECIES: lipoyl synthase [Halorubrum]|uniref:Lipoyl synthase n=1 Tax=Halorubrum sodomense TaxID=35743 RepID=A0A1I6FM27_HALSD|nr:MULTISPECIES: lipoyl synthase [Halorubrum]TKX54568.1 lipoyl synthase [Halorubrum sp. SP3]TKX66931.1 lipoyl synthase [Halorubrum sp. SP9]SFR30904.1 lipoic acid synthetase [Halorubrum sodomense]